MKKNLKAVCLVFVGSAVLGGCAVPVEADMEMMGDLDLGEKSQEIKNGSPVTTAKSIWRYVAKVPGCTGTIIGPRHVLTAAHCSSVTRVNLPRFLGQP